MGKRRLLIALVLALLSSPALAADAIVSWEEAGCLKPDRPARPRPTEPDTPSNGPFRLDLGTARPDAVEPDPPASVPPPVLWESTDAYGQRWRHADRVYLQSWVAQRNASIPRYQYGIPQVCGPGGCPRR